RIVAPEIPRRVESRAGRIALPPSDGQVVIERIQAGLGRTRCVLEVPPRIEQAGLLDVVDVLAVGQALRGLPRLQLERRTQPVPPGHPPLAPFPCAMS